MLEVTEIQEQLLYKSFLLPTGRCLDHSEFTVNLPAELLHLKLKEFWGPPKFSKRTKLMIYDKTLIMSGFKAPKMS